jgi:hypothetical protein
MKSRIMYIECKGNEISALARIGRVTFSKSGKSLYYRGRRFHTLSDRGFKANYFDWKTREHGIPSCSPYEILWPSKTASFKDPRTTARMSLLNLDTGS